jgi:phosphocarrier protein HPr
MAKLLHKVRVKNILGLHARAAAQIVKLLRESRSKVFLTYRNETVDGRSILGILMLAAGRNAQITLAIEGEDAQATLEQLIEAFNNRFGELR